MHPMYVASGAHDLLVFLDFLVQSYKKGAILMVSAVLLKVAYKGILVMFKSTQNTVLLDISITL